MFNTVIRFFCFKYCTGSVGCCFPQASGLCSVTGRDFALVSESASLLALLPVNCIHWQHGCVELLSTPTLFFGESMTNERHGQAVALSVELNPKFILANDAADMATSESGSVEELKPAKSKQLAAV